MPSQNRVVLRRAEARDIKPCGEIFFEAFRGIAAKHNFPPEMPSREVGIHVMEMLFTNPGILLRCGRTRRADCWKQLPR